MNVVNTPAYNESVEITAAKGFIVQASWLTINIVSKYHF